MTTLDKEVSVWTEHEKPVQIEGIENGYHQEQEQVSNYDVAWYGTKSASWFVIRKGDKQIVQSCCIKLKQLQRSVHCREPLENAETAFEYANHSVFSPSFLTLLSFQQGKSKVIKIHNETRTCSPHRFVSASSFGYTGPSHIYEDQRLQLLRHPWEGKRL